MNEDDRKRLRKIGFWMNRINDAWNMGEADWAKDERGDVASRILNGYCELDDYAGGLEWIEVFCKVRGIDPKRHRGHKVG